MKGRRLPGSRPPPTSRRWSAGGHTLVELLVVLFLLPLLLGLSYEALASAYRFYRHHAVRAESREAARIAAEILVSELRSAGPADLYALAADSVALRSTFGVGVVCEVRADRLILWRTRGIFGAAPTDSALVFVEGEPGVATDDTAAAARIVAIRTEAGSGCPGGRKGDLRLIVEPTPPPGITVGAPLRVFRPHVYRLYRGGDGRWWLGQRLRGGIIQPIAGPLAPPGQGGLRLQLLDSTGRAVRGVGEASGVRVRVRSLVRRRTRRGSPFLSDSVEVRVALRNR